MNEDYSIRLGELKEEIDNENGCFDEMAKGMFKKLFRCKAFLDKSSNDKLISLDHSIICSDIVYSYIERDAFDRCYIDGAFIKGFDDIYFSISSPDGRKISSLPFYDIPRKYILKFLEQMEGLVRDLHYKLM